MIDVAEFADALDEYREAKDHRGENPEEATEHSYWVAVKNLNRSFKDAIKATLDL